MSKTDSENGKTVQDIKNAIASHIMPAPTENDVTDRQEQIEQLKTFLSHATEQWDANKPIRRFPLPTGECISCIYWNSMFFISGTDIIRALTFRFHAFGRPVTNIKKFEEGVFSDLRNLKSGKDAILEVPKSELLDLLYKFGCIRTQKKQKVFYWFSVPHDRLFLDALDRDLKREKMGIKPTTKAMAQPAISISSDTIKKIFHELKSNLLLDKRTRSASDTSRSFISDFESNLTWQNNQSQQLWSASDRQQQKHPRVNSVPSAAFDQLQSMENNNFNKQNDYLQQQQEEFKHTPSSACHFTSFSTPNSLSTSGEIPTHIGHHSTNEMEDSDYLDPIANGVNQLEISNSHPLPPQHNNLIPLFATNLNSEKATDPEMLKKTKAIFGNLSLLGGSPSYKQRRSRTNSISSSTTGGPDRIRRDKGHLRATTTIQNSRLAMAAVKAGFVPEPSHTSNTNIPISSMSWQHASLNYHCPVDNCRRLFKRVDLLDLHISLAHAFMCSICGRRFSHADSLIRHGQLTHETLLCSEEMHQALPSYPLSFHDISSPYGSDIQRSTSSLSSIDYNMLETKNYPYLGSDMLTSSVSSLN